MGSGMQTTPRAQRARSNDDVCALLCEDIEEEEYAEGMLTGLSAPPAKQQRQRLISKHKRSSSAT